MARGCDNMDDIRMQAPHRYPPPARESALHLAYLYGGVAIYRPGEALAPRVLKDYELVLLQEGGARYRVDRHTHQLRPGGVVLARPGFHETYEWDRKRRTRHAYFHFGIDALPRDWPAPRDWPIVRDRASPAIIALFDEILARAHRHHSGPARRPPRPDERLVEALVTMLLDPVAGAAGALERERPVPAQRAVKWMREVIDETPGRRVRLADLARAGGVSAKHLCRVFDEAIGRPPMETYRLLRLQLAVALLARSNLRIQEIALRCGFEDALYFSRCFSDAYGLSPRATRERMQRGRPPPRSPLPADLMPRLHW